MRESGKERKKPAHVFVPVLIDDNSHPFERPEFWPVYEVIPRAARRPAPEILHLEKDADFLVSFDRLFHYRDQYLLVVLIGQLPVDQKPDAFTGTFGQSCYHTWLM